MRCAVIESIRAGRMLGCEAPGDTAAAVVTHVGEFLEPEHADPLDLIQRDRFSPTCGLLLKP